MLKLKYTRRTYYVAPEDDLAIATIQAKYGLSTHSDCVRFALRLTAQSPIAVLPKKKGKTS